MTHHLIKPHSVTQQQDKLYSNLCDKDESFKKSGPVNVRCKYSLDADFLLTSLSKQGLYKFCWQCVAVTRVTEILFPCSGSSKTHKKKTFATLINQKLHWKLWTLKTGHVFLCDLGKLNPHYRHFFLSLLLRKKESARSQKKSRIHRGSVTKENIPALRSISVFLQPYFNWLILGLKYEKVWHL